LFRWLKDKGVTAIITGESGDGELTRQGLEEYVSDCVILLDHRVNDQMSTRRLRIVKYRGTMHGTNEYPFIIGKSGISVLPITSISLDHEVSSERISTGVQGLDEMLGGKGVYRGSHVLISGTAGVGKTSFAAHFAAAACRRGERALYFSFEEPERQLVRNMRSIGLDLDTWLRKNLLRIHASRPALFGLEAHLVSMHNMIEEFSPSVVVIDPANSFTSYSGIIDSRSFLMRLLDFLRSRSVTAVLTSLTKSDTGMEDSGAYISSIIDTWMLLRDIELAGERNKGLYVLKSRGMQHSNQIREYQFSEKGVKLVPVYVGPEGVLTGSMRVSQESREAEEKTARKQAAERRARDLERKKLKLAAEMNALRAELESVDEEVRIFAEQERAFESFTKDRRDQLAHRRGGSNGG
jgi:circadian clock protein KaiC